MMQLLSAALRQPSRVLAMCTLLAASAQASDHLDTPSVIADPRADIGDLYAWMAPDGRRLNLAMTIVGRRFSDRIEYIFHIDSGAQVGRTRRSMDIRCRFPSPGITQCRAGDADEAKGDASREAGLESRKHGFRVFAGLRDDPFFNNVRGTRAAYSVVFTGLQQGAQRDAASCPMLDGDQVANLQTEWRHTDGQPGSNFLKGWTTAALVVSIDLPLVAKGGQVLGVWAATVQGRRQIDRAGRPLTGNALLGTIASDEVSDALKEQYNAATPSKSARFVPEIAQGLALYDGFDGACGNQWLADPKAAPQARYHRLAKLLADDRLWVNASSRQCTQLFAVELAQLSGQAQWRGDCGGRAPSYSAVNVYRSLLANGSTSGIDDGVARDEKEHSDTVFPFLAAPDTAADPRGAISGTEAY
ncbi:DUF4331 family protein [Massilia endophytica]|uniref:DUF4331 family protein n=1 Tax=Massilia endophytica TaxID=2899220 RepID=UPI001E4AD2A0|nr:DUF4331 family protein [Massilia endophytica]UGQ46881.1 DUF4331 domain-containing protein [Massilia endophytica]